MTKVMFVCHGNICRSPICEMVLKDMTRKRNIEDKFHIESSATSNEEIGNDIYPKAKEVLRKNNIDFTSRHARKITRSDYEEFDYIICMDTENIYNLMRIIGSDDEDKVYKILDFADDNKDVEDPWYTNRFDLVFDQIKKGCIGLLNKLGY